MFWGILDSRCCIFFKKSEYFIHVGLVCGYGLEVVHTDCNEGRGAIMEFVEQAGVSFAFGVAVCYEVSDESGVGVGGRWCGIYVAKQESSVVRVW